MLDRTLPMPAMPLFGASFPAFADVSAATPPPPTFAGGGTFSFPARGCPPYGTRLASRHAPYGRRLAASRFPLRPLWETSGEH